MILLLLVNVVPASNAASFWIVSKVYLFSFRVNLIRMRLFSGTNEGINPITHWLVVSAPISNKDLVNKPRSNLENLEFLDVRI